MSNVELLNGTDYFNVDSDGVVSVKSNVKIDREEISEIVIKARLQVKKFIKDQNLCLKDQKIPFIGGIIPPSVLETFLGTPLTSLENI